MRSVSYVQRVALDFGGSLFPHAICLGDADNDTVRGGGGPGGSGERGLGVALPGCRGDGCEDGCCVGWRAQGAWKYTQFKRVEAGVVVVVYF